MLNKSQKPSIEVERRRPGSSSSTPRERAEAPSRQRESGSTGGTGGAGGSGGSGGSGLSGGSTGGSGWSGGSSGSNSGSRLVGFSWPAPFTIAPLTGGPSSRHRVGALLCGVCLCLYVMTQMPAGGLGSFGDLGTTDGTGDGGFPVEVSGGPPMVVPAGPTPTRRPTVTPGPAGTRADLDGDALPGCG